MYFSYERPVPIVGDVTVRRIFAQVAYQQVRHAQVVPVVHAEVSRLVPWFPIVWRSRGDEMDLVAVRSLLDRGRGYHPFTQAEVGTYPLLLQAYPFLLDPAGEVSADSVPRTMLDDVVADAPTNVGAPVTDLNGQPSRATAQRATCLGAFARHHPETRSISDWLSRNGMLEPWHLSFDIEQHHIDVPNLFAIRQEAFTTGRLAPLLAQHGASAAGLLGLHRISLFRAGVLLAQARAALQAPAVAEEEVERDEERA